MHSFMLDTYYATGRRHVERAAMHASNGRMDWAFRSLQKAQRSFDKGIERFQRDILEYERSPFVWQLIQDLAGQASADMEHVIVRGIVTGPVSLLHPTATKIGMGSRVLRRPDKPNLMRRFLAWIKR